MDGVLTTSLKRRLPTGLTVSRLALGLAFPFVPAEAWLPMCVVAGATEFLDGFLSRRWQAESDLGRQLDPIADKVFVVAALVTFVLHQRVTVVELLAVGTRDIVVASGLMVMLAFGRRAEAERCSPRLAGKITTWFQFAFLLAILLAGEAPAWPFWATFAISTAAAADYVVYYFRDVRTT